jgi:hypothetical protein
MGIYAEAIASSGPRKKRAQFETSGGRRKLGGSAVVCTVDAAITEDAQQFACVHNFFKLCIIMCLTGFV